MENQETPEHIQSIFEGLEKNEKWNDPIIRLFNISKLLSKAKPETFMGKGQNSATLLRDLKNEMGEADAIVFLEWIGITIEGENMTADKAAIAKLDDFLNKEVSRYEEAHPIGKSNAEAA